jgi:hypothetical protein
MMAEGVTYELAGADRNGTARTGRITVTPAEMAGQVERWYKAGWRWLAVRHGGRVVAEITRCDRDRRTWYAEVA